MQSTRPISGLLKVQVFLVAPKPCVAHIVERLSEEQEVVGAIPTQGTRAAITQCQSTRLLTEKLWVRVPLAAPMPLW